MSTAVEALKAYIGSLDTKCVEVPEMGAEGEPLRLYYTPFNGVDMAQMQRKHKDFPSIDIEAMVDVILMKALTSDGEKAFGLDDKPLLRRLPQELIFRIATPFLSSTTVEEHEGN